MSSATMARPSQNVELHLLDTGDHRRRRFSPPLDARMCGLERGDVAEQYSGGVVTYWSPEQLWRHGRAAVNGGDRCCDDLGHESNK
jgi:hypothetical protein